MKSFSQTAAQFAPKPEAVNWQLLMLVLALSSFGLVMVTSSSMAFAETTYGDAWFFAKRYAVFWLMGIVAATAVAMVPIRLWEKYGSLFLILSLLLLTLVLIPGVGRKVNGSQRWLQLGPIALQASELAKFCAIVFFSSFLARRGNEMLADWRGILKPLLTLGLLVFLLLLEPDFGTSVVMMGIVMAMLFVAGMRLWQFVSLFALAAAGMGAIAVFSPYRLQRLITFLDPWADQFNSGYQLTQSLIAYGRGQWTGLGLGNSVQKLFYLPEAHTDFIFAIVAEEFGLVGVVCVLGIFVALIITLLHIAQRAMSQSMHFVSFASFGVAVMFAAQAFINMGVSSGLLPTKGLTMPFISYGGSSLLVCCMLIGLMLRADYELREQTLQAHLLAVAKAEKAKSKKTKAAAKPKQAPLLNNVVEAA